VLAGACTWEPSRVTGIDGGLQSLERKLFSHSARGIYPIGGCIQKFPDWPPGARTANDTALCN
jgi:hypothetical protein